MSRSRRRTPIFGITTARSEKQDKKTWHRKLRVKSRIQLLAVDEGAPDAAENLILVHAREVSNPWSMAKDGKRYWAPERQRAYAERRGLCGQSLAEQISLLARHLHKAMSK